MKPSTKFGLLNGGLGILFALLMFITGLNRSSSATWIQWIGLVIPITCMYLAITAYKTGIGNGWITFGKAFNQAFMVGLIGGLIGSCFHYIYVAFIDPAFIDFQKQVQLEKFTENGMSDEMIEQTMQQSAFFMTPHMQAIFGIIFSLFFAAVLGLIMAGILKKPNPEEIS